jgi:CRISPR-associated endonuclease/helicase Cas3
MRIADEALARGIAPLVYHSRFRYVDRVQRHGDVIRAFDPHLTQGAALAVTTQVAEMSLDLSADLLVTDLAAVPALIQRLGRLNRRSSPEAPEPVKPFVVLPFVGQPYETEDLEEARVWLESLRERDLSQRDLVQAWAARSVLQHRPTPSTFRQGGFCTEVGELREASPGLTVLLSDDAELVRRGQADAVALALPMGLSGGAPRDFAGWQKVDLYPIAPPNSIDYDAQRGGQWRAQ